jgi:hypothetical protein
VRPVKKRLLLLALALAPVAPAQAQAKLTLVCTGWQPVYQAWEAFEAPPQGEGARVTVEIDRVAGTLSTALPHAGAVTASLEVSERYYRGTSALGRLLFNRSLDAVELSINRLTGEGRFVYMVGETGYPAFSGHCTRAGPNT